MRSLKAAFTVSTSKLLRSISEVHKLNVPYAVSQEPSVCNNFGRGLCDKRSNGYL